MAWLTTSKTARKAGHVQTAYSAILQAGALHAPFTFVQQAKLMRANGQPLKALSELENVLPTLRLDLGIAGSSAHPIPLEVDPAQNKDSIALAKVGIARGCRGLSLDLICIFLIRPCPYQRDGLSRPSDWMPMTLSSVSSRQSNWRQSKSTGASFAG